MSCPVLVCLRYSLELNVRFSPFGVVQNLGHRKQGEEKIFEKMIDIAKGSVIVYAADENEFSSAEVLLCKTFQLTRR